MSLFRSPATKLLHQIKFQQASPISTTANFNHEIKPPATSRPSKKPASRPAFNARRATPASRQSRRCVGAPAHLDRGLDFTLFASRQPRTHFLGPDAEKLPAGSSAFGKTSRCQPLSTETATTGQTSRCDAHVRPFIGVSSTLRTRRLMTPMTPMSTVKAIVATGSPAKRRMPLLPMVGVSSRLRTRPLMTPMTPMTPAPVARTMMSEPSTSKADFPIGYALSPRPIRLAASLTTTTPARVATTIMSEPSTSKATSPIGFAPVLRPRRLAASQSPMTKTCAVAGPSGLTAPFGIQTRNFTKGVDCTEKIMRNRKPCFAVKYLPPKPVPIDWTSPCACDYEKPNRDRCSRWKCRPSFCVCPKPSNYLRTYQCPKRVRKVRMRTIPVKKRKIRLGYKQCVKPPKLNEPFQCFPKPPPPPPPPEPTPKRCPCFKPKEMDPPPVCKKVRCAVESSCTGHPRQLDASCPCKNKE